MIRKIPKAPPDLMAASHHIARKALMEIHRLRETKRKIFAEAIRRFEQRRILALRKKLTS